MSMAGLWLRVGDGIATSFSGRIRNDRLRWQVTGFKGNEGILRPDFASGLKNDQRKASQE